MEGGRRLGGQAARAGGLGLRGSVCAGAFLILIFQAGRGWAKSRGPTALSGESQYAGSQACIKCHPDKASALETPMGRALALPQDADVLRIHPQLSLQNGRYTYSIFTTAKGGECFVTDGKRTISAPIVWAVGYGNAGQTYILLFGRHYLESQVSYYGEAQGLGITVGHTRKPPRHLEEAMGSPLTESTLRPCLDCHATSAVREGRLALDQMSPGIGCERCHGPGAAHIAAVAAGNLTKLQIINPGKFSPAKITEFCASCHRTKQDVAQFSVPGVGTVRFEAYRLGRSRCFDPNDSRITCTTCHDPHRARDRTPGSYDARCLACHDGRSKRAHTCSVGTQECVTCHMPKVRIPQADASFTDHWIRIARPGQPFPD